MHLRLRRAQEICILHVHVHGRVECIHLDLFRHEAGRLGASVWAPVSLGIRSLLKVVIFIKVFVAMISLVHQA